MGLSCAEERRDYRSSAPLRAESAASITASAHRGFFGCNHFVQTNQWLVDRGETPIDWMPVLPAESE